MINGLPQFFSLSLLADLTEKDKLLSEMKKNWLAQNFAAFRKIPPGTKQFFSLMLLEKGIVLVDNRIAVPADLREAVLTHLHLNHPDQVATSDAASYLWWPKMHRAIINKAEAFQECTRYGKNVKTLKAKSDWENIPEPTEPNEELQIDFAGPFCSKKHSKTIS